MVSNIAHTGGLNAPKMVDSPRKPRNITSVLVEIPPSIRAFIIIYFLVYQFFIPLKAVISTGSDVEGYIFAFLNILLNLIILAPVLFSWKSVGLLHPLVWPNLFSIAKSFKDPLSFVTPFFEHADLYEVSSRYGYITKAELIDSNYKLVFLQILSTIVIYGGYFITKSTYLKIKPRFASLVSKKRLVVWAFVCLFISYGFFLTQGGVMAWVNNWGLAGGRDEATAGFGPILSFIGGLYYIPALWLLFKNKKAFNDVFFWFFTIIFTLGCFAVTGSRYAVLQALTIYLMAWVLLNRNFPVGKVFLGGCGFVVLFGMLGMLRTSGGFTGGAADWSVLNGDVSSYIDYAMADAANRADAHTDLTIIQKVPDDVDYLYGQSYLSVISTYVPRALWPDKPHTGAYYTGNLIFNVQWGVPPGEVGEAYWNFGYIGFILFFFIKGALYKIIVNTFTKYYMYPAVAIIYFVLLFDGGSFVSLALTDFLRELIFLIIGLKILKLL